MLLDLENLEKKYELKINGVLHIGAHHGQENEVYKRMGISNKVFFEPLKKNYEVLVNNVDDGICVNIGLGNFTGEVEMFVESANQGQSSSILEPDLHLKQYPHIVFDSKETVNITRLDDFLEERKGYINLENYNFINIDVQGFELEVFKGASETLNNIDYVMSEINRDSVYVNCPKVDEIDAFLKEYGFNRVETSWAGGTWGDGFYVKEK